MLLISSPIPSICITPAPPEEIHPDPYSPFPPAELDIEDDGYRAKWLTLPLPPASSPWHSSPLQAAVRPPHKGLDRDQFDSLLRVSRDQRAKAGSHRAPDLRKELALKNPSLKQLERRTRFLSRVNEPSCATTISISEIPLESPMTVAGRDEQVERGLLISKRPAASSKPSPAMLNKSRRIPPSLDEITTRLKPTHVSSKKDFSRSRLPKFLKDLSSPPNSTEDQIRPLPVRSLALNGEMFDTTFVQQVIHPQHPEPCALTLESRSEVTSPTVDVVVRSKLHTNRVDTARDMIVTLSRRSSPPPDPGHHECTRISTLAKRFSAPAELQRNERIGFDRVALSRGSF